jgi:hypothetical protein
VNKLIVWLYLRRRLFIYSVKWQLFVVIFTPAFELYLFIYKCITESKISGCVNLIWMLSWYYKLLGVLMYMQCAYTLNVIWGETCCLLLRFEVSTSGVLDIFIWAEWLFWCGPLYWVAYEIIGVDVFEHYGNKDDAHSKVANVK